MNNKIILLVLTVFVLSLAPSALADNGDRPIQVTAVQISDRGSITAIKEVIAEAISETNASGLAVMTALRQMNTEQIRNFQQEKMQVAIERCGETNASAECQEKLQTRINLVERLGDQDLERLNRLEQKKQDIIQKIKGITQNPNFAKFMEKGKSFVARALAGVDVDAARAMFQKAKGLYEDAVRGYKDSMDEFNQTREQLKVCETDCEELESRVKLKAQGVLNKTIESVTQHMEKVKARIMESETLSDEEASELLAKIEARLGNLEALKARVQAMDANTTKEEIQNLTREMKQLWAGKVKALVERASGFVQTSRMGGITVQLNHLEQKLTDIMARMVEQGKDITVAEPLVEEFNSYLDAAEQSYSIAVDKFKEAADLTGEDRSAAISEAQTAMSEAKSSLGEAHATLRDIVREIQNQTASAELEDDESYEELAEVEEELGEEVV